MTGIIGFIGCNIGVYIGVYIGVILGQWKRQWKLLEVQGLGFNV